ncbi:P-loop NTPase fold protein [Pararobbsia silviterrae]|uniref:KAP NTPase domain-containing protein n=1 Tax=Pararobbsia silviterrae TaxID=1792498 RepID=A0A494XI60_9BURK|nr:P-loop NTPase fold protein [Pararobbsia silviterrae]RKP50228.1 hypothetical protein D7S86_19050 [Pararobbsia silviterrae]
MSDSAHQQHRKLASAEAAAFARVVVAGGPAAPASIALFSESPSSKGLFIDRVITKIRELTKDDPAPGEGRLAVVRYMPLPGDQGQLWGQIVEHLFSELKLAPARDGTAAHVDPLAEQITRAFKLDDQAVHVMRARERVARAEENLEKARKAYEDIYGKRVRDPETVTTDVTREVFGKHLAADKPRLARFGRDLGVRSMDEASIKSLMVDASSRVGRTRMLASSLIEIAKRRPLIFAVTTILAILGTAAATVSFDSIGIDYLAKVMPEAIARPVGDVAIAITAAVLAFRIGLFGPARAISYLRGLDKEIETTIEREIGREKTKASAKVTVLAKRETGFGDARQVLMAAERELNSARAALAAASPGGNPNDAPPERAPRSQRPAQHHAAGGVSHTEADAPAHSGNPEADEYADQTAEHAGADAAHAHEPGADDDAGVVDELSTTRAEPASHATAPETPIGRVVVFLDGLDKCGPIALADALRAIDALMTMPQFTVFAVFDQERMNKTLRRETEKRAIEKEDEGGNRRVTDDAAPGAAGMTLSDDYLCGRFDTLYWIRDEVEPDLAHNSASVAEHLAELASDREDDWWYSLGGGGDDASNDGAESVTLTQFERRLIQKLDVIANQTPGGGQRLVHAYYLIKTAIGASAHEGFVGAEGERPHYRAVLAQLGFICGLPRLYERYVAVQSTSARRNEDMYGLIQRLRRLHFDRIRGGGRYMEILRMLEEMDPGRGMVHALAHHANTVARFSLSSPELVPLFDPPRNREGASPERV